MTRPRTRGCATTALTQYDVCTRCSHSPYYTCLGCGIYVALSKPSLKRLEDRYRDYKSCEEEESKQPIMVKASDVEKMYWLKDTERWLSFYRAIRYRPEDDDLCVSGLGQYPRAVAGDFDQACLWSPSLPWNNKVCGFDCHYRVDVMEVDLDGRHLKLGYAVHSGCWLLIERVIGGALVRANLQVFKRALQHFWIGNKVDWNFDCKPPDYNLYHPVKTSAQGTQLVAVQQDPVGIIEIQHVIARATCPNADYARRPQKLPGAPYIPLEIAILIVNTIYHQDDYGLDDIRDTRNLLTAFQWELPVTYWQSRCKPDLIFEVKSLFGVSVDWPALCFGLEKLFFDEEWYSASGLRNRGRIFGILRRINDVFQSMLGPDI